MAMWKKLSFDEKNTFNSSITHFILISFGTHHDKIDIVVFLSGWVINILKLPENLRR